MDDAVVEGREAEQHQEHRHHDGCQVGHEVGAEADRLDLLVRQERLAPAHDREQPLAAVVHLDDADRHRVEVGDEVGQLVLHDVEAPSDDAAEAVPLRGPDLDAIEDAELARLRDGLEGFDRHLVVDVVLQLGRRRQEATPHSQLRLGELAVEHLGRLELGVGGLALALTREPRVQTCRREQLLTPVLLGLEQLHVGGLRHGVIRDFHFLTVGFGQHVDYHQLSL